MLYVVATPIGNLEDITLRALRILKEVELVLCEDTRVTGKLLQKYDIKTRMGVFHANTAGGKIDAYISMLEEGKDIALVTDAGTPGISDPGVLLVMKARELDLPVNVIPGPSALTAAISGAGVPMHEFVFLGFLPQKKGRETLLKEIASAKRPYVFYESPHKILKTLEALNVYAPKKQVVLARELTKIYEESVGKTAAEHLEEAKTKTPRGEYVVIVH